MRRSPLSGHCISYARRGPPLPTITFARSHVRASRRAVVLVPRNNEANRVQSLAPSKKKLVTGLAVLPIGKEFVSSRLFAHQQHSQCQRWSALSQGTAEPLVAKRLSGFAFAKSFLTLPIKRLRLGKAKSDPLLSPIVSPLCGGKSTALMPSTSASLW